MSSRAPVNVSQKPAAGAAAAAARTAAESTLIPLNLVYTYPVRWSRYQILRDLIQNFYDAVGAGDWSRCFSWSRAGDDLTLEVQDTGFSYEWLLHIGASTKTAAAAGRFAGFFGEGFKIAALCALRDHGWEISMASRDWELEVTATDLSVDGATLRSLGYRVRKRSFADATWLRLRPFGADDEPLLEAALLSFFYPENPLLGARIWADDRTAFYHRSARPKPERFPKTGSGPAPGIVFAARQAMGSFEIPLVVAVHDAGARNRDREDFLRMDVVETLCTAVRRLPAAAAAVVLEAMRSRWYAFPARLYDFDSVYPVVHALARRVAQDAAVRQRWRAAHPDLLVARRVRRSDVPAANRRKEALAWLRQTGRRVRLVQNGFAALGYPDLESACELEHGFARAREPEAAEARYLAVLEQLIRASFPRVLPEEGLPAVRVIDNATAAWRGSSDNLPAADQARTAGGGKVRYRQSYIALGRSLLAPEQFAEALATYLHELAHVHGGDRSAAFSAALTDLIAAVAGVPEALLDARQRWQALARRPPGEG